MNVIIDEKALEKAMHVLKGKTYSGTINRALEEIAKQDVIDRWSEAMREDDDPWWPGYVEEMLDETALKLYRVGEEQRTAERERQRTQRIADSPVAAEKKKRRGRGRSR